MPLKSADFYMWWKDLYTVRGVVKKYKIGIFNVILRVLSLQVDSDISMYIFSIYVL